MVVLEMRSEADGMRIVVVEVDDLTSELGYCRMYTVLFSNRRNDDRSFDRGRRGGGRNDRSDRYQRNVSPLRTNKRISPDRTRRGYGNIRRSRSPRRSRSRYVDD